MDKEILENINIDKEISENIDIDKISNQLEFGISNRASDKTFRPKIRGSICALVNESRQQCFGSSD